jgi:fluoride ion exporter CrcB/FEX
VKRAYNVAAPDTPPLPNGSAVAAILSAGIGCFVLAVLAILADNSALVRRSLVLYKPTGVLSGVTTVGIFVWLFTWGILDWRWRKKTVLAGRVSAIAVTLLVLSLMLTFPPVSDLF